MNSKSFELLLLIQPGSLRCWCVNRMISCLLSTMNFDVMIKYNYYYSVVVDET